MKVAIHQPNFIPWFPFFYKMAMVDTFVILSNCQFEKNGFQNRVYVRDWDKWLTKPVKRGLEPIVDKEYVDGSKLIRVNMFWILAIRDTLGIKTRVVFDYPTEKKGTARILEILNVCGAKTYVVNKDAKNKYLDEKVIKAAQIDLEYCEPPKECQKHIFEMFKEYGIEGTRARLPRPVVEPKPKKKGRKKKEAEIPDDRLSADPTTAEELFGKEEADDYDFDKGETKAAPSKESDKVG
jgi:hypothetical protein